MEASVFCNLILEDIYHSFCHMLLVTLAKWNTMWINKSVNIRRWQLLRIILESGYYSEEMVPMQQNLLDNRGKEDAVCGKLDQKWLSIFTLGQDEGSDLSSHVGKKKIKYMKQRFQNTRKKTAIPER